MAQSWGSLLPGHIIYATEMVIYSLQGLPRFASVLGHLSLTLLATSVCSDKSSSKQGFSEWLWHMIYLLLLCSASYNLQIFKSIEISSILRPGLNQQKSCKRKRRLKNNNHGNKLTVSAGSRAFSCSKSCTRRRHLYFPYAYLKDINV